MQPVDVLDPATGGLSPDVSPPEQDPLLALAASPLDGKIWVITLGGTLLNADLAAPPYFLFTLCRGSPSCTAPTSIARRPAVRDVQGVRRRRPSSGDSGTLDTATATVTEIGPLTGNVDTEAITVWGKAALGGEEPPVGWPFRRPVPTSDPACSWARSRCSGWALQHCSLFVSREVRHDPSYSTALAGLAGASIVVGSALLLAAPPRP